MEGAGVVPAGDLRIEVVVVQGLVGAGGDVHLARRTQRQLNGVDNGHALADQDVRAVIKGLVYDVLLIDNPDEMNEQLEIYLRKVGAWDGC